MRDDRQETQSRPADNIPSDGVHGLPPCPRRKFLNLVTLTVGGIAVTSVAVPILGALVESGVDQRKEVWRDVGPIDSIQTGQTRLVRFRDATSRAWSGVTAQSGAWLRREADGSFLAFSITCRHLGCPVRWENEAELFMCPCHGGVYYKDGTVAAGPPPEPLAQYRVRIRKDRIEMLTREWPLTLTTQEQM